MSLLAGLLFFAFGKACKQAESREIAAAVILLDVSDGARVRERCRELGPRFRELSARRVPFDLQVMTTGNTDRPAPRTVIAWLRWSPEENAIPELINGVVQRCETTTFVQQGSPLFAGISRAIIELDAHCEALALAQLTCGSRTLYVHSDFQETEDPDIKRTLQAKTFEEREEGLRRLTRRTGKPASLTPIFCGLAETSAVVLPMADSASMVWAQVFRFDQTVVIESSCARSPPN